ncbi:MAG: type II methionyl aminopeptidase [Nanoarchaeota archaeon]
MEEKILEKYKKAGSITASIREDVLKKIKPGMKILELADFIENEIEKRGGKPAFPVNISINNIAAHDTPRFNDEREIKDGDIVKIDIGVHVDGYIGDMAFTYCSNNNPLVKANQEVLEEAIKILKPGVTVAKIGKTISSAAEKRGYGLILNLTGHTLDKYIFHGQPSILNVDNDSTHAFKEGDVIALEPFLVESNSQVKESGTTEIYRYLQDRPVRLKEAREILATARDEFKQLPFAKRWLYKKFSPIKVALAMRQLEGAMALETYPILRNINNSPISQAEHTIIITKDGHLVTTR